MNQLLPDLYESAYNCVDAWDHDGLKTTIIQMHKVLEDEPGSSDRLRVELFETLLAARLDDEVSAMQHLMAARLIPRNSKNDFLAAELLLVSARVSLMIDETAQMLDDLAAAWRILENSDHQRQKVECAILFSVAFRRTSQWTTASGWLDLATEYARAGNFHLKVIQCLHMEAGSLLDQGDSERKQGNIGQAHQTWLRSLSKFEALKLLTENPSTPPHFYLTFLADYSSVLARLDRRAEAVAGLKISLEILQNYRDTFTEAEIYRQLAVVYLDGGELPAAKQICQQGIALCESIHSQGGLANLLEVAADIAEKQNDHLSAITFLRGLLRVRDKLAIYKAHTRAQVMEVRLETDRALAQAAAEHRRADEYQQENLELRQRAESLFRDAQLDPLTGLANRRCFDAELAAAHADAVLHGKSLCIAMIDIDHFKKINDEYGHPIGDLVLRHLAQVIRAQLRHEDLVARIGGEEFAMVLHNVGIDRALVICERVRQVIEDTDWSKIAAGLALTTSIGLSDIGGTLDLSIGLSHVDSLLYKAKDAGRNRIAT